MEHNHASDLPRSGATDAPGAEYSGDERRWLLRLAHGSIRAAVFGEAAPALPAPTMNEPGAHLSQPRGAFVTLHENGELRGCIGSIAAVQPLDVTVRAMAKEAAMSDPRFPPVQAGELDRLQLEISVLSPMFEIAPQDVVVGRHGLMISHGGRRGLLLPQVPVEWHWDREMFLAQTCRKAGLPLDAWRHGARIEAFTAEVFSEATPCESLRG